MKLLTVFFASLLFISSGMAQLVCTPQNRQATEAHLTQLKKIENPPQKIGDKAVMVGKRFLGTPYVAKTLEIGMDEKLVINLRELDCTTFLEYVVVMSGLWEEGKLDFQTFEKGLEYVRYRDGKRLEYPSRLHYFSEWIANNEEKGVLKDITAELGGQPLGKTINFMSTHRDAYMQLKNDEYYKDIQAVEAKLAKYKPHFIPKSRIPQVETQIHDGDLIALATSIKGLDVVHVGFAYHKNGRLHFLHASTGSNKVEISSKPLADYMAGIKHQTGIMVARLQER